MTCFRFTMVQDLQGRGTRPSLPLPLKLKNKLLPLPPPGMIHGPHRTMHHSTDLLLAHFIDLGPPHHCLSSLRSLHTPSIALII